MKKEIIDQQIKKDLTVPTHYTIRESIVKCIKQVATEKRLSESKIVNTILEEHFKR